jgi:hypothetical protein
MDVNITGVSVYSVTNWTPPAGPLVENGEFSTGCFSPWVTAATYTPIGANFNNSNIFYEVIPCGNDCKSSSKYYVHFTYINTINGPVRANAIFNMQTNPAIIPGMEYTLSVWIKGNGGILQLFDATSYSFNNTYQSTGAWEHVSFIFAPDPNFLLWFEVSDTSLVDWYVDDVQVVANS